MAERMSAPFYHQIFIIKYLIIIYLTNWLVNGPREKPARGWPREAGFRLTWPGKPWLLGRLSGPTDAVGSRSLAPRHHRKAPASHINLFVIRRDL
jgi:hypothetical protein